jgi:hypothetical protein
LGIDENDSCKHEDTSKERKKSRHFSKPDPGDPTCYNRNKIKKARSRRWQQEINTTEEKCGVEKTLGVIGGKWKPTARTRRGWNNPS